MSTWMPVPTSLDVNLAYDPMSYDLQTPTESFAQTMADEARTRYPNPEVRVHVVQGDAATEITAASTSARLTVIGTHGCGGLIRLFAVSRGAWLIGGVPTALLALKVLRSLALFQERGLRLAHVGGRRADGS